MWNSRSFLRHNTRLIHMQENIGHILEGEASLNTRYPWIQYLNFLQENFWQQAFPFFPCGGGYIGKIINGIDTSLILVKTVFLHF